MKNATLCYIRRRAASGYEYLMLYRNKKKEDPNEGKWIGVGGKFEPGETPDACMLREVKEETGLVPECYHFCGVIHFLSDEWEDEDMYLYRAEVAEGDVLTSCDEGELRWVAESGLMDLPMWEGDKLFLKPLMEGADSINMTLRYEGDRLAYFSSLL
jgi:8-oxo-dGTP diphosphatase